jgi:hypothetical protein
LLIEPILIAKDARSRRQELNLRLDVCVGGIVCEWACQLFPILFAGLFARVMAYIVDSTKGIPVQLSQNALDIPQVLSDAFHDDFEASFVHIESKVLDDKGFLAFVYPEP